VLETRSRLWRTQAKRAASKAELSRPLERYPAVKRDSPVDPMRLRVVRLQGVRVLVARADVRPVAHLRDSVDLPWMLPRGWRDPVFPS
jgi:hypothetical protein